MAESAHSALTTTNLHVPGYLTGSDPGAVGAGKYWVDTTGGTGAWVLKVRNAGDTDWEEIVSGGAIADHNHTTGGGDGGDLDGARVGDFLELTEVAAPGTPAAGLVRLYAKSDGALYQKDDAGTETGLSGGGGGGGATIHDEAYGSPPGSEAAGDLWLPTDSFYALRRNDGDTAWVPWGPLYPMTLPVDGDYAWINQGAASVSAAKGGLYLSIAAGAAGQSLRIRKKTAPATPYTITAALQGAVVAAGGASEVHFGLCFRQSSDGKLHTLTVDPFSTVTRLWSTKWTNATTFSAQYTTLGLTETLENLIWFRIADDGTNRICSISRDGQNFLPVHSVGRTDFLTADEVGFYISGSNAAAGIGLTLLSWKEA